METTDPKYKHKPSEKHTLEEVLKSLQDLIRNDLAEGAATAGKPPAAPPVARNEAAQETRETKTHRENTPITREDFAPVSPGSGPVNLDAVMRSLKDLIGNELSVGDEPKPPAAKAAAHEEYLADDERIEEYIPEELGQLDDVLNLGEELAQEEPVPVPAPPPKEPSAPQDNIEASLPEGFAALEEELTLENLAEATPTLSETPDLPEEISLEAPPAPEKTEENPPQEFTPLDEELTLEELAEAESLAPPLPETPELSGEISLEAPPSPEKIEASVPQAFTPLDEGLTLEELAEAEPPAPPLPETPQLPGEISPAMLSEPEVTPPAIPEAPRVPENNIASGTQHEMFFEESPAPSKDTEPAPAASVSAPELGSTLELVPEPVVEPAPTPAEATALPTIEVEESTEANTYFEAAAPSVETPPPSEEITAQAVEISSPPEQPSPPVAPTLTAAAAPLATSEPPPAPAKKKITLEIVDGPVGGSLEKPAVDFDAIGLAPSQPEPTPPPVVAEIPAPPAEAPVTAAAAPEASPAAPEPEPPKAAVEVAPAVETKAETVPEPVKPPAPTEPKTTKTPPAPHLDDLPVLNEIVAPPMGSVPAAKSDAPPPRPAPDRARDIVVRAVAKLNVELRKSGSTGLDTKTILRLQQLIRQELEKGGEK